MQFKEGKVLYIKLDSIADLDKLAAWDGEVYTTGQGNTEDVILDVSLLEGLDDLMKTFTEVSKLRFDKIKKYDYIVCWR